ncbi:Predicted DNA binding protein, contains HTH domain [Halogeometricum rufum]|jgi:predicted DNA binding protein|uniref:Predicted DNA binding protein, contains HTH domain n=1 Tax=Halogeometricum rufum TaxID=553469 RepID=A0A1I6J081_9EURY|nr:helix-turn-helix domain-containing protein [Halogeometricum rufum]SFR72281.1 Predicted DNA binding protein, contains HTH domain [Halogeometricum rufum]
MIDITVDVEQYDCPFVAATDDHPVAFSAVHWEYDTAAERTETRMVVEADDRESLDAGLSVLRDHEVTADYRLISRRNDVAHIRTVIGQTDAMRIVREEDGFITGPSFVEDGSELWHIGFDDGDAEEAVLSRLDRNHEFDVVKRNAPDLPELTDFVQNVGAAMTLIEGCRDLSTVERQTLESAVDGGYFQSPRSATLGSLADEFDVSKPAVSKNLRRGQRKMIERVVNALDELDD